MNWLQDRPDASVPPMRLAPWLRDTKVTVKPPHGKPEGAVEDYNLHKPGRLSHAYHAYHAYHVFVRYSATPRRSARETSRLILYPYQKRWQWQRYYLTDELELV